MMGGRLEVKSVLAEGSEFSFTLALAASDEAPRGEQGADLEIRVDPEARIRVLVVDDQESNRLVLREMLERIGLLVDEARDGREAVERALESGPEIVFMDIKMPVMDGYEAVGILKKDRRTSLIRVFALTASAFSHDERRIAEAGFDGFLPKPFKQSSLHRLVRDLGGIETEDVVENSGSAGTKADVARPDRREWEAIGTEARTAISDAALINDFASLGALADTIVARAPGLAGALARAAASYDEAALGLLIDDMTKGDGDGR
jgi:CheY-like chemotaxis protein